MENMDSVNALTSINWVGAHLWQDFLTNLTQNKDSNGISVGKSINSEIVSSNHNQCEHLGRENVDDGKRGESGG